MSILNLQVEDSRKKYIESNRHYSRLIESVGAFGHYQKQITAVVVTSWLIVGLYEAALFTFYDLGNPDCDDALPKGQCTLKMCEQESGNSPPEFAKYFPSPRSVPATMPYNLEIACRFSEQFWLESVTELTQMVSLLLAGWLATIRGKKRLVLVLGFTLLVGTLTLMFNKKSVTGTIVAEVLIGASCLPMSILLLTLVPELMTERLAAWVMVLSLTGKRVGQILVGGVTTSGCEIILIVLAVLLPSCILYFAIHCYFYESPRHLMDTDILKAFEVLKNIANKNNSEYEQVDIENSFVMSKIKIRKYNYASLFRYRSLRIQSYAYAWVMLMMGVISQYPSYLLEATLERSYQQLGVASIELVSLLPCFLFIRIYPRKLMSIVMAALLFLLCFFQPFRDVITLDRFNMLRVAILGLVCISFAMLGVFLTVSIVETYPHTVRTLAMCFLYSCFLFGRFAERLVDYLVDRTAVIEEMFAEVAFLLLFHTLAIRETKDRCFLYEVEELNDDFQEDALLE